VRAKGWWGVGGYKIIEVVNWYNHEVPDTLDKLIEELMKIKSSLPKEITKTQVELGIKNAYGDDDPTLTIFYERPETEEEEKLFKESMRNRVLKREQNERQAYHRLREKFANDKVMNGD
jgi:hypothetical protein